MPVVHLPRKNEKSKGTGGSRYTYQNELNKACFQNGMAYRDFKDLNIEEQLLIKY